MTTAKKRTVNENTTGSCRHSVAVGAAVHQVQRSHFMKTSIHQHGELELYMYSVSDVEPVELVMQ